jgi:hypothetical protein
MVDVTGHWVLESTYDPLALVSAEQRFRRYVRFARSRFFFMWGWTLRVSLLGVMALSGTALYWLWFDNVYGNDWTAVVGGAFLSVVAVLVGLWTFAAWHFDDIR